jgi:hypothetical protein
MATYRRGAGELLPKRALRMTWSVRFRDRVALAIRLERVDQRLHRLAVTFFVATFVACTIHFGVGWLPSTWVCSNPEGPP